jgi:hypothetical protein
LSAAVLAAAVILLAAWLTAELMELTAWGIFAVFVLVVGCNRFFFPTSYELTALGITARYPLKTIRYQWPELRRFVYDRSGGFLSPRARRSFLDEYRGISLLFPDSRGTRDMSLLPLGGPTVGRCPVAEGRMRGSSELKTSTPSKPLTLTLSPKGRGDKNAPRTLSLEGRWDKAQEIIQEICRRLPSEAIVRDAALARKEANSCGG